jgi:hypothetical protein
MVIFPYIGGEEVNSGPIHAYNRYAINFGERSEEECYLQWLDIMVILEIKVKPERLRLRNTPDGIRLKQRWWAHSRTRPKIYSKIETCNLVIVVAQTSKYKGFAIIDRRHVFDQKMVIFPSMMMVQFSFLQLRPHVTWSEFQGSSLEDRPVYTPSDCFETFPFPTTLLDSAATDSDHEATRKSLEAIGEHYHQFRAELMIANNEGLTSTYNRFHDPSESSSSLLELRRLHEEMDQAVLAAYGWSDVPTACGFGLDYLDLEEDARLPDELQDRIDSGELFFWEADVACAFEAQVRAYGAVKGKKKLPWRYRWPDDVRDDVLARLLALNAERYDKEVVAGLHGKGGKQGAKASKTDGAAGGKRRGRPAKASQVGETGDDHSEQMGLGL